MEAKTIHVKLNPTHRGKLEWLAEVSRRTENDVIRLLIEDATAEQLGVQGDATLKPTITWAPGGDATSGASS